MRKYSRKHGCMLLKGYASGSGAISFTWVSEQNPNGECVSETVTESDVSEWMRLPEQSHFAGYEILDLSISSKRVAPHQVCLFKPAIRPFGKSKTLEFDGDTFRYARYGGYDENVFHPYDVDFYEVDDGVASRAAVVNVSVITSLCFFLNNEEVIAANGYETKKRGKREPKPEAVLSS